MELFIGMLTNIIILVARPFSLIKVGHLGSRIALLVIFTWFRMLKAIVSCPLNVCGSFMFWTIALVSLPFRMLNALQRERVVEFYLHEMEIELQNLVWEKKELDKQLQLASKDRRFLETLLAEMEEENDKAIVKIDQLKNELQVLKDENLRLNCIQVKGHWDIKSQEEMGSKIAHYGDYGVPLAVDCCVPPWKSGFNGSGLIVQDLQMDRDAWEDEKPRKPVLLKSAMTATDPYPCSTQFMVDQRRDTALSQSVFSTILSLVVGMIIWEAEDPCMPLVVALFIVVCMSLKSVILFFSTIRNKPASEAVALLSFNCFILGALTCPTLPTIAHVLAPPALRLAYGIVSCLGFSFSLNTA